MADYRVLFTLSHTCPSHTPLLYHTCRLTPVPPTHRLPYTCAVAHSVRVPSGDEAVLMSVDGMRRGLGHAGRLVWKQKPKSVERQETEAVVLVA